MTDPILSRRPPPPLPVFVVTGFLGAGKTTLLNRLLRDPALADSMVIINEFGEIGLDHLLIEKVDGDLVLLQSGCLCCTIRGDLIETLENLLRRLDNGRIKPFRRVIIETTGLADPAPVLHSFMSHPYLLQRYHLQGVLTLVDAVNGAGTLEAHVEARKQAAMADWLVITKGDLADGVERLSDLRLLLSQLNPAAAQADVRNVTSATLEATGLYDPSSKTPDVGRWLGDEAVRAAAAGRHGHSHQHDPNRHDRDIRAWCLTSDAPVAPGALDLFLQLLRDAHGSKLLRVKGIVALSDDASRPLIIQGVQHVFHPPVRLDGWPSADRRTRIVFIMRDLDPAFIEGLWAAFSGVAATDRADRAALLERPLGLAPGGLLR